MKTRSAILRRSGLPRPYAESRPATSRAIELFRQGKLPVEKLLSTTGPLDEINTAFDRLDQGEVVRHVIAI